MRVEKLYLRDVGPFDELTLDFGPRAPEGRADIHILTGENGTGKTTVLMALAALFGGGQAPLGGLEGFDRRRRNPGARAEAVVGKEHIAVLDGQAHPGRIWTPHRDVVSELGKSSAVTLNSVSDLLNAPRHYASRGNESDLVALWRALASAANSTELPPWPGMGLRYAALAYSGGRAMHEFELKAIQELTTPPLRDALSFSAPRSGDLAQWIANTRTKELFARTEGRDEDAQRRAEAIESIERALSEAIQEHVAFVMDGERLRVQVKFKGRVVDVDVLPEGLRSILSWVGDLLMRLDRVTWAKPARTLERPFLLLLDEIDVHLHPAWQRRILPMVQGLFPNAQVFVSTHSPLVVGSVSDARIHPLVFQGDRVVARPSMESAAGESYASVLKTVFDVKEEFDLETEKLINEFRACRTAVLKGEKTVDQHLQPIADKLRARGLELRDLVGLEMRQLERQLASRA